jgi:hypothetical protein
MSLGVTATSWASDCCMSDHLSTFPVLFDVSVIGRSVDRGSAATKPDCGRRSRRVMLSACTCMLIS